MPTESQKTTWQWAADTFGVAPSGSTSVPLRVLDEAAELAASCGADEDIVHAIVRRVYAKAREKGEFGDWSKAPKEAGDVLVTLRVFAGWMGFDLDDEAAAAMQINRVRRWRQTGPGTGQHIPKAEVEAAGLFNGQEPLQ